MSAIRPTQAGADNGVPWVLRYALACLSFLGAFFVAIADTNGLVAIGVKACLALAVARHAWLAWGPQPTPTHRTLGRGA